MRLTDEQRAVMSANARLLRVNAFAGTGKTVTLKAYSAARPEQSLLYVAFNKSIAQEAQQRFPGNVTCKTLHALAYAHYGRRYRDKLVSDLRPHDVVQSLALAHRLGHDQVEAAYALAFFLLTTLKRWLASAWDEIDSRALPDMSADPNSFSTEMLVALTRELWARMRDPEDPTVGMLHDGYLKLYQLSQPALDYTIMLFDEAQDANPVTTDILLRQQAGKVFVGDSHQQIYAFRGANDALQSLPADKTLVLSASFRFGPRVADLANRLLSTFKGEPVPIQGLGTEDRLGEVDTTQSVTWISRSNSTVFDHAVRFSHRSLYFVGGLQGYRLERIVDAYHLCYGGAVCDPYLRQFADWETFLATAKLTQDRDSLALVRTVYQYGHAIPALVRKVRAHTVKRACDACVILCTAHKSKGMEFDQVVLSDDYTPLFDERGAPLAPSAIDANEINILYVALTRACKVLQPNNDLKRLLAMRNSAHTRSYVRQRGAQ